MICYKLIFRGWFTALDFEDYIMLLKPSFTGWIGILNLLFASLFWIHLPIHFPEAFDVSDAATHVQPRPSRYGCHHPQTAQSQTQSVWLACPANWDGDWVPLYQVAWGIPIPAHVAWARSAHPGKISMDSPWLTLPTSVADHSIYWQVKRSVAISMANTTTFFACSSVGDFHPTPTTSS